MTATTVTLHTRREPRPTDPSASAGGRGLPDAEPRATSIDEVKARLHAAACDYAREHGPLEQIAAYVDGDGVEHAVCVNFHPYIDWRVLDVAGDLANGPMTLVERMDGVRDLRNEAVWVASDYASQCRAFHDGARREHPLPRRPTVRRVPVSAA